MELTIVLALLSHGEDMSADEWLRTADALGMFDRIYPMRGPDSAVPMTRQVRMYLVACAKKQWRWLPWACRQMVLVAEQDNDTWPPRLGQGAAILPLALSLPGMEGVEEDWVELDPLIQLHCGGTPDQRGRRFKDPETWQQFARLISFIYYHEVPPLKQLRTSFHNADLVREIFSSLTLTEHFDVNWRTEEVRCVADDIYMTHQFQNMPILADALEETGCTIAAILDHCRNEQLQHVRGCWALDLVRGVG